MLRSGRNGCSDLVAAHFALLFLIATPPATREKASVGVGGRVKQGGDWCEGGCGLPLTGKLKPELSSHGSQEKNLHTGEQTRDDSRSSGDQGKPGKPGHRNIGR